LSWAQCQNCVFLRGDVNCDGTLNVSDIAAFNTGPANDDAADFDDNGVVNGDDLQALVDFLFFAGNPPACPYPTPGRDCTSDNLEKCCSPPINASGNGGQNTMFGVGDAIIKIEDNVL
jgi:hypothetical protein